MKRLVTMFTAILTVIVMTGIPTQAKESKTVWIETEKITLVDGKLDVIVSSNGAVTDGLLTLKYDPEVLTIKENGITAIEFVEMFSANVVENEVRISFVAEDAIPEGETFTLSFSTESTDVEEAVKGLGELTGEVSETPEDPETPDTDSKEDLKDDQDQKDNQDQKDDPTTGDSVNMGLSMTFLIAGTVCVVAGCTMKRKGGDHSEI